MESIRVRNILSNMDTSARANLKRLLPKKLVMPTATTARYPSAILAIFPKDESYSLLGYVAEELLRLPHADINIAALHVAISKHYPEYSDKDRAKLTKSKTTQPFLDIVVRTRAALTAVVKGTLVFDTAVKYGAVEGHPDAQTETQIFEVKLTGLLKKNWTDFLFQIFAYAALHDPAKEIHLVLPLQATVWSFTVTDWKSRTEFRDMLNALSVARQVPSAVKSPIPGQLLQMTHCIGNHISKGKSIAGTITALEPIKMRPFQMFLSGPQSTKVTIKDEELAAAATAITTTSVRLYVHSAYVINLCQEPGTYGVECLIKNLEYSEVMGLRGVVVHVGKSTKMELAVAEGNMRANLELAMEKASDACPILLETPAGQGTEMLTVYDDVLRFVQSFKSKKLRVCIDTCHVFASGQNPLTYIKNMHAVEPTLIKLVHFNDSATGCGSCVDRHAYIGTGEIGFEMMKDIADYCKTNGIPMLVE